VYDQEIKELAADIENAEKHLVLADALKRLQDNADFKKLILDEFLVTYAAGLVRSKAMEALKDADNQAYISREIDAVGFFNKFLNHIMVQGNMALETKEVAEATIESLRASINVEDKEV